jgi:SAM-dependent methyltransferase/uncharacterized protein YbaR (Trm112 family)
VKSNSLQYLVCPNCNRSLIIINKNKNSKEIFSGNLFCENPKCNKIYHISQGLIRFTSPKNISKEISNSFGFEWRMHLNNCIEKNTVFGRTYWDDIRYFFKATGLTKNEIKGKVILDAGCGSGKLTRYLARLSPKIIFGQDIHSSIKLVFKKGKVISNSEIIYADLNYPPFKINTFDVIWCNGVLHHNRYPEKLFSNLAKLVKPGGLLYIWVYERKFSPYKFVKDVFRFFHIDDLSYNYLFIISQIFSLISVCLHSIFRLVFIPVLMFSNSVYLKRVTKYRTYNEFLMTWLDSLSPKYDYRFTKEEVTEWFVMNGFTNLQFLDNQIGICGKKRLK